MGKTIVKVERREYCLCVESEIFFKKKVYEMTPEAYKIDRVALLLLL
jgi:hypothetical protein